MTARHTYPVRATREGHQWVLSTPAAPDLRACTWDLADADQIARAMIAVAIGVDADDVTVIVDARLEDEEAVLARVAEQQLRRAEIASLESGLESQT